MELDQAELFHRAKLVCRLLHYHHYSFSIQAHDREVSEIRTQHEMEVRELIHKYEDTIRVLRADMEQQRKAAIQALSDEKKNQISKLTDDHLEVCYFHFPRICNGFFLLFCAGIPSYQSVLQRNDASRTFYSHRTT